MSVAAVSPVLIGRGPELSELDTAFAEVGAGLGRTVLVGGEAGVGKTRLIREFGHRVRGQGARVLVGGCMELGVDGFPFAPFTAVLRGLVREIGADGVSDLLGGRTDGLARLLPEFGDVGGDEIGQFQTRLFELVLTLLDRLAAQAPLVLVVEDAHWADKSSRALLTFLIRNLGSVAPLMIVITYRSDELHRTHPLRPLLAELDRIDRVSRHELGRLTRREVAELMARLRDGEPEADRVEQFYRRSEGNPLFVEALMDADGQIASELPESLRDLLLAGVQRLPEETQELLRIASAGGARIEHRLLAAVSGAGEVGMTRDLRPAVAGNVLVVDGDGYSFRHALIREALHDDLLPGEHTRLHTRYAETLEDDATLVPPGRAAAELAFHWHAAHNTEWALISAWHAAKEADRAAAYAEELRFLERVLELWDQVPGADGKIGKSYEKILRHAVTAADWAGDSERGVKLGNELVRLTGEDRPLERAFALELRGRMKHRIGREDWLADLREALRLVDPLEPSRRTARIQAEFARFVFMGWASGEADVAARRALVTARQVQDPLAESSALLTLACLHGHLAYGQEESPELNEAERLAVEHDFHQVLLRSAVNRSHFLEGAGRHVEAADVALRGLEQAKELGLFRIHGSFLSINYAESLYSLGRWDEAMTAVDQALAADPPRPHQACLLELAAFLYRARGEFDLAAERLAQCRNTRAWEIDRRLQEFLPMLLGEAELALSTGDNARALDVLAEVLPSSGRPDEPRYTWPALVIAARAVQDAAALAPFRERAETLPVHGPLQELQRATFRAEAARTLGGDPGWQPVIDGWERIGQPAALAQALISAAEHDAAHAAKDRALTRLNRATLLATPLGAVPLQQTAQALTRRIGGQDRSSPSHGLTARELEVLRHLSVGRSNREIATELFISAKTASVHVSNILAKLGATTRTEAASTARRLGVDLG
ncbi:LuxR family transcriptional regulator [Actinocorallia lasiicapitis]